MNKYIALFLAFFQSLYQVACAEYLYPVGSIDDEHVLLVYQTSCDDVELWMWNINESVAFKELNSFFLPLAIQILPSKKAYSFIDRGRIKIKHFDKRAPRVIAFYEPIYAVSFISWIDDNQFYFVGKYLNNFKLFLCDISNRNCYVFALTDLQDSVDYLYPQKINNEIFCITKTQDGQYAICKAAWPEKSSVSFNAIDFDQEKKMGNNFAEFERILLFSASGQAPCFLFMKSSNLGFLLKITQAENSLSDFFDFVCCRIFQSSQGTWSAAELFNFQLPKKLLVGSSSERLYESIYPFLPLYSSEAIYFTTFNHESQTCQIARFDNVSGLIEQTNPYGPKSLSLDCHLFAPYIVNNAMYCGISTSSKAIPTRALILNNQTSSIFQCQLPRLNFKNKP